MNRKFRLSVNIGNRIRSAFAASGVKKATKYSNYGIDINNIIETIGYKLDNRYHLEHIIPIFAFDCADPVQVGASWHPKNLRWLLSEENYKKSSKYDKEDFRKYMEWFTSQNC